MKITFPHMGITYIPVKMILDELNIEAILPPKSNKRTLEIGTKCSPETICVPFKIITGNIIEGIEKGADTVFMLTGCGPCRFGIFSCLQEEIMKDLGYEVEFITADRFSSYEGLKEFVDRLKEIAKENNYFKVIKSIVKGFKLLNEIDKLYDLTNYLRAREKNMGEVNSLWSKFEEDIIVTRGYKSMMSLVKEYYKKFNNIAIDRQKDCLKIGLVGEIYTILEPFININIERKLGSMGVEVIRMVKASEFVREQLDFLPFLHSEKKSIYKAASKYLDTPIGGHAIHTIGNIMRGKKEGFDGFIHLLPFTCMPEIVAESILPTMEKKENVPIMSLVLDEMTGDTGYMTRIEAFIDLVQRRRELNDAGKSLSWN
ncbi:MAG TPA: acyl-CoA dehydratase activase-related protein [Haloplasmataceae bacterium]